MAGHDFAARSCCDLDLQGSNPNVKGDISSQYGDHFCEIFVKSDFKKVKLLSGHDFAPRSCCDLDLQGIDPIVVRNMSS